MGPIFLGESRSRLYPHMRAKFGRDPTAGSKKLTFKFISRLIFVIALSIAAMSMTHMVCVGWCVCGCAMCGHVLTG